MYATGHNVNLPCSEDLRIMNIGTLLPEHLLAMCAKGNFQFNNLNNEGITYCNYSGDSIIRITNGGKIILPQTQHDAILHRQ